MGIPRPPSVLWGRSPDGQGEVAPDPVQLARYEGRADRRPAWGGAQATRADRSESQVRQFVSFRLVVGASWHRWADEYDPSHAAHQIDAGVVQVDDPSDGLVAGTVRDELTQRMSAVNFGIYDIIQGETGL